MKLSKKTIAIFLGPMVALYTLVIFYPSVRTMLMSFFSVSTITDKVSDWTFYGLQNFVDLFKNDMFMRSMGNIVKIWFYSGIVTLSLALLFAIVVFCTRIVSLASILCAAVYPFAICAYLHFVKAMPLASLAVCTVLSGIMAVLVIYMHRENIKRLCAGTEYKFGTKPKP